jgi:hypothetical protein
MSFAVEIIATQYQTGKLFLGYHPYYTAPVASTAGNPDNLTNYGMVIEINKGRNVFEMEIPWFFLADWATVIYSSTNATSSINSDIFGHFYICPVNQLSVPSGTPTGVKINVYVRGGEDFEFSVPIGQGVQAITQGSDLIGRSSKTRGTPTYMDVPRSVRDLIRRPMYYTGVQLGGIAGSQIKFALISLDDILCETPSTSAGNIGGLSNNMAYWNSLYRAYVGDLRVKVMVTRKAPIYKDDSSVKYEENNYPVHCAHIPLHWGRASGPAQPSQLDIMNSTKLWLAQRYSQATEFAPASQIILPGSTNVQIPLMGIGTNSYPTQQACALFEETIIDPIRAVELEIPYNGVARFATRRDFQDAPGSQNSHRSGWGYLLLHSWANQPILTDPAESVDFTWADIYVGAADNLRYGMHTGVPNLSSLNTSTTNPFGRYVN